MIVVADATIRVRTDQFSIARSGLDLPREASNGASQSPWIDSFTSFLVALEAFKTIAAPVDGAR